MTDTMIIIGLHSRTPERLLAVASRWNVPAFPSLEEIDFDNVDVVAISVQTEQNPVVLKRLEPFASRLSLIIDTPISWTRSELAACYPMLQKFKRVLVAEDYMNFPSFALLRRAVLDGLIGKLHGVALNNIGFLYHGLALIRSFVGFERAKGTWARTAGCSDIVGYSFDNGYKAIVVGPYRRHSTGGITIEGEKGVLTDFSGDRALGIGGNRPVYSLTSHRASDGLLIGYSIEGDDSADYRVNLPAIRTMADMDIADKSDLNLLRGCGLMHVFRALHEPANLNNAYGASNAVYDSFLPRIAARGVLPIDPLVWFHSDIVTLLRMISRA